MSSPLARQNHDLLLTSQLDNLEFYVKYFQAKFNLDSSSENPGEYGFLDQKVTHLIAVMNSIKSLIQEDEVTAVQ